MRLLFAEDDRQLRESVTRGLREASYAVDQADTGSQALTLSETRDYDAIILDILLPEMSGVDVCREIRKSGNEVPILMLTALDSVEQRIAGLDAGADDYLTKPFDFGELVARIRAISRRRGAVSSPELVVGDLVIDINKRSVRRNKREISLTAKEFALLLHLAQNAGRVVTRAELMAHVWEDNRGTYSNIIDVYAGRLRKKIDEGERIPMVTTMRGTGLMLDAPAEGARGTRKRAARARE
jgi:two-component system copper resistance phosphate regulon response regulator CusR